MRTFTIKVSVKEAGKKAVGRDLQANIPEDGPVAAMLASYLEQSAFAILEHMFNGMPMIGRLVPDKRGILATVGDDWP